MRKPPYTLMAAITGCAESPEEFSLIQSIDILMRTLWVNEHIAPKKNRNEFLQKHIEAAYDYYESFSEAEMAELLVVEAMMAKMANAREEAETDENP